jgi:hypothetical protein
MSLYVPDRIHGGVVANKTIHGSVTPRSDYDTGNIRHGFNAIFEMTVGERLIWY